MSEDQIKEISVYSPEVLEQKMLEKNEQSSGIGNPEDLAAAFFKQNYPRLKNIVNNISRNGLERAVICAAAYPLVPDGYKVKTDDEKFLSHVLEQMVYSKIMMVEVAKLQKIEQAQDLEKMNELTITKGENNNGNE